MLSVVVAGMIFSGCENSNKIKEPITTTMEETTEAATTTEAVETTTVEETTSAKETTTKAEITTEETEKETTKKETTSVKETAIKEETTEPQTTEKATEKETTTKAQETTTEKQVIKFTTVEEVVYATGYTKVYADYSTSAKVVGELGKGNALRRVGKGDGWSKIYYKGDISYVPSKYLTTEKETETTTGNVAGYEEEPTAPLSSAKYREDLAKDCFKKIKELRVTEGKDTGLVKSMMYPKWDPYLEEIAKKRAKEIRLDYSHNSKGNYTSVFRNHAENLAITYAGQVEYGVTAYERWYDSQGHYNNMFYGNKVGIACWEYNGILFWVYISASDPYLLEDYY